ncbi:MAG: hypothetical protein RL748_2131 [Pseudomonadota bacterium]
MNYARVFQPGNNQALQPRRRIQLDVKHAEIFRRGDKIIQRQRSSQAIFDACITFPADFMAEGREDAAPQEREGF